MVSSDMELGRNAHTSFLQLELAGSSALRDHRLTFLHSSCLCFPGFQTSSLSTVALFSQLIILTVLTSVLKLSGNHFKDNSRRIRVSSSPLVLCMPPKPTQDRQGLTSPTSPAPFPWQWGCLEESRVSVRCLYLNAQPLNSGES